MSSLFRVALLCAVIVGAVGTVPSQPLTLFEFPTNGLDDVDPSSAIVIKAPAAIEPASITFVYPDAEHGVVVAPHPTIHLVSERGDVVYGRYRLEDERTLVFQPSRLQPGTRYRCIVSGLYLLSGAYTALPTEEIIFTTAAVVPRIVACSLEGASQISCSSPIRIHFNRAVGDDLPEVLRTITLVSTDTANWPPPIEHGFHLSDDGLSLDLFPVDRWPAGRGLQLRAQLSGLTGDALDDRIYSTVVRDAGRVAITVRAADGRTVPTALVDLYRRQEHVAVSGTPIDLVGLDLPDERWRFVRWQSPVLDMPADRNAHVTIPCELYAAEIPVEAILVRLDTIAVEIAIDSGGVVDVWDPDGHKLMTVTDTAFVHITDALPDVHLVARADSLFSFAAWQAVQSSISTCPAPATPVLTSVVRHVTLNNGSNARGVRIMPSFRKTTATSENYALRGYIQDVDAQVGFDAEDAVAFTTPREFRDVAPGDRTLCVQASRCWEIIGYTIGATGERVDITPTDRTCVTAELLDPENTVSFHVRRKPIQLRLERVLIASDDPDDVIKGKRPHAETYIRVEVKTTDLQNVISYQALGDLVCDDNGMWFGNYGLRCGDEVRLRVRGSAARSQKWITWDRRTNYVIPDKLIEVDEEITYTLVIDQDLALFGGTTCELAPNGQPQIRIRGCFRQDFGVEAISLRLRKVDGADRGKSFFAEEWLDPLLYRDRLPGEPLGGRQIEYIPRHGTIVKVRYTMPIDVRTIHDGGMEAYSYDNTLITEPLRKDLDFTVRSSDDEHISFEPVDGKPITTVVYSISDPSTSPRMQALHGGSIDLRCFTSVRSLSGLPLRSTVRFILSNMELPGYGVFLRDITYDFDGDNDFIFENYGETYHAIFGGILGADQAHLTNAAFRRVPDCSEQQGTPPGECTLEHSDKDGAQAYGDMLMYIQPHWMDRADVAWWYAASYDEDCKDEKDCFVNNVMTLLDLAREKVDSYRSTDPEEPISWGAIVPDVINLATGFIQALMPVDDQDDHLGYGNFLETAGTWWGVKQASYPLVTLDRSNARYRLLTRLFTLHSVIR